MMTRPQLRASVLGVAFLLALLVAGCGASEPSVDRHPPPDIIVDLATTASQSFGDGMPEWAAYAPITRAEAKKMLGDDPFKIWRGIQDSSRLYLIVLKGRFDARGVSGVQPGPGPYLSLFAVQTGAAWSGTGYAVTDAPPAIAAGRLQRFDLSTRANPGVWKVYVRAEAIFWLYLVPCLLFVAAYLLWWKEGRRWPYVCGIGLVLVAAGMQIARTAQAMRGVSDSGFVAMQTSVLGMVVALDVLALAVLVLGRHRAAGWDASGESSGPKGTWRTLSLAALVCVAALYLAAAPILFTTGE